MNKLTRQIGKRLLIEPKSTALVTEEAKNQILLGLKKNGVVCLNQGLLTPQQQCDLTRSLFTDIIRLPPILGFDNQDPECQEVSVITNTNPQGKVEANLTASAKWSQDGHFYRPQDSNVFNLLHSVVTPKSDGQVWFLDLVSCTDFIKTERKSLYRELSQLYVKVDTSRIPELKGIKPEDVDTDQITYHKMINVNPFNNEEVIFLGSAASSEIVDKNKNPINDLGTIEEIIQMFVSEHDIYRHHWQEGDIMIWDNIQVMHRFQEICSGKRILHRTQGQQKRSLGL
ncbi:-like protein [Stylonychia lemnae]|uniref:-like protein n=1 Tax=Stylonychia lemnae TaxID=5949 RepID=A0A078BDK7_STYLE|nr:-like protein [Stylonychia lemnae]|eukprot:CDW91673.1 -like protein [Stylonychia lemnae]